MNTEVRKNQKVHSTTFFGYVNGYQPDNHSMVVSKYGDYKNSDGTSSDSKSGDYLTIIY